MNSLYNDQTISMQSNIYYGSPTTGKTVFIMKQDTGLQYNLLMFIELEDAL